MTEYKCIMGSEEISGKLERIGIEIAERNMGAEKLALVGIVRRGAYLSRRLAEVVQKHMQTTEVMVGSLDITLYGEDHRMIDRFPLLNGTDIPFSIQDIPVVLVDDILYTGKTIHRALEALLDLEEPSEVQLAAFLDRGRRCFPISADYVGARVPSARIERVVLHMTEVDGVDEVVIERERF